MTFRHFNEKYLLPATQTLMILGIVALCQPWSLFFHRYGLTIILIGLVGFLIAVHIKPEPEAEIETSDDEAAIPGIGKSKRRVENRAGRS
jgi:uncharacterized membrane protein YraQ (UPF0718 family)